MIWIYLYLQFCMPILFAKSSKIKVIIRNIYRLLCVWGENVSKSKCPFAECYIYLVTSARGCALLVPGNNWPLPAAPRPELRASVSAPRVSEVRILTLASTSGARSLVLLQMPSKWVNTLWLYKLISTKTFAKLSHKILLYWLCLTSYPILTYGHLISSVKQTRNMPKKLGNGM